MSFAVPIRLAVRTTRQPWLWLITAGLLFAGLMVLTVRTIDRLEQEIRWVSHTNQEVEEIQLVYSVLTEVHAANRGYALTGDARSLNAYHDAASRLQVQLSTLRGLFHDDPQEQQPLADLESAVKERLVFGEEVIQAQRNEKPAAARALVPTGRGQTAVDRAYAVLNAMTARQEVERTTREADLFGSVQLTRRIGALVIVVYCVLLAMGYQLLHREIVARRKSELRLETANENLTASIGAAKLLVRDVTLIGEMSEYLQSCRTLDEAYVVLGQHLAKLFPDIAGSVAVLNNSRNFAEIHATWGNDVSTSEYLPDECWALRRGQTHTRDAATTGPDCSHYSVAPTAAMCVPLLSHGEPVGVLHLTADHPWTAAERRTARAAADQIGLAISNLKLLNSLRTQSIRDPLTGLFNRRYLEESLDRELERARRRSKPVVVLMLDIDHFKQFNDSFGHEAGGVMLTAVGSLFKRMSRGEDIACRYGGEEFTIILPECSADSALQRANEIRLAATRLQVKHHGRSLKEMTISIGIAVFPEAGTTRELLIAVADAALYRAKASGRNRVVMGAAPQLVPPVA